MNYQAIRAVLEAPLLAAYNGLSPAVPVYFDNVMNDGTISADEFVDVNIQFSLTTETALTDNPDYVRGVVVIRTYTPKGKGPARNGARTAHLLSNVFGHLRCSLLHLCYASTGRHDPGNAQLNGWWFHQLATATATALPTGFGALFASITYTAPAVVGSVRDWSFEITRAEIDVTTIGQEVGQYTPFRNYISGFADGSGSATVYTTDDDTNIASRMIEDVIQRTQSGARMKLYIDQIVVSGTVNDTLSRFISVPVILTSASLTVNPDDGQSVAINFRPSSAPDFDLSKS
jgi:hypothetical protein